MNASENEEYTQIIKNPRHGLEPVLAGKIVTGPSAACALTARPTRALMS